MSSRKTSADPDYVYRSTPTLKQKKFPSRRRAARSTTATVPSLTRHQQSTLTQLDFCTPRGSSDRDEISEEEGNESRPKRKRRRINALGKRQSTLTQLDFMVPTSSMSEEGPTVPDGPQSSSAGDHSHLESLHAVTPSKGSSGNVEVVASTESRRSMRGRRETILRNNPHDEDHSRLHPSTPRKRWKEEVPSSQSPQSILLSSRSRSDVQSPQMSPLRERSTNIQSTPRRYDRAPSKPLSTRSNRVESLRSPIKHTAFRKPAIPVLKHATTIPDSDGLNAEDELSPRKKRFHNTIEDSQWESLGEEILATNTMQDSVEDTQFNPGVFTYSTADDDYDFIDPACSALDRDAARYLQTQRLLGERSAILPVEEDDSQIVRGTFDHSAFRAHETTMHEKDINDKVQEDADDEDFVEIQSPRGYAIKDEDSPTIILPPDVEVVDLTSDELAPLDDIPSSPPLEPQRISEEHLELEQTANEPIRSSPPPPMIPPSQASTVDVTQFSPQHRSQHRIKTEDHHQSQQPPRPSSPFSHYTELPPPQAWVSSSPIPLPPLESSPSYLSHLHDDDDDNDDDDEEEEEEDEEHSHSRSHYQYQQQHLSSDSGIHSGFESDGVRRRLKSAKQILPDSMLDFSLPPPPPVGSWRKNGRKD